MSESSAPEPTPEEEVLEAAAQIIDAVETEPVDELAERTADLQRLQADYANYRKRVDRDRSVDRDNAIAEVLGALLPLLDDFARANEHGELVGAFKSVSDSFDAVVARFGLETYGVAGEEFDPALHEALAHQTAEVEGPTKTVIANVFQAGYRRAGRVLRPARVAVADVAVEG